MNRYCGAIIDGEEYNVAEVVSTFGPSARARLIASVAGDTTLVDEWMEKSRQRKINPVIREILEQWYRDFKEQQQ